MILLTALLILGATIRCFNRTKTGLEEEIQNTLRDVAQQNVMAVQNEIKGKYNLLVSIAEELRDYSGKKEDILNNWKAVTGVYHLKRLGYANADGTVHTTDGFEGNLSFRDFFKMGMNGEVEITDALTDTLGLPEKINVFSVPVYGNNNKDVQGVLFATYRTAKFRDSLDITFFENQGYSCIVKKDGAVILDASNSPLEGAENIFDTMMEADEKNRNTADNMLHDMRTGGTGEGSCLLDGEEQYFYYTPLNVVEGNVEWYMLTVVPSSVLTERIRPILTDVGRFLAVLIVGVDLMVFFYLYSYRKQKQELVRLAYVDNLTQGDNFACFCKKMEARDAKQGFMVALGIRDFGFINDTCGLKKGDEILKAMWEILQKNIQSGELSARIGGDDFILFVPGEREERILEKVHQLDEKIRLLAYQLSVPAIVPYFGIYRIQGKDTAEKAYGFASLARHLVKERQDESYAFYNEEERKRLVEDHRMESEFDDSIEHRRFEVWYQPKCTMNNRVVGSEALVRWRDKDGALVPPFRFIPLFEKNGMISRLDEYVFEAVCMQQKAWKDEGKQLLPISVNISRVSLYYPDVVEKYQKIVQKYGLDPDMVQLEITESALIGNDGITSLVKSFHKAGFKLLLDDFGTGNSSLSSLNMMCFDTLKIDKSFVDHVGEEKGETLLSYIVNLARNFGMSITAEGVETEAQAEFLDKLHCDDIQGYYFSKPLPCQEYEEYVKKASALEINA